MLGIFLGFFWTLIFLWLALILLFLRKIRGIYNLV
jgi:hypothetical protein